MHREHCALGHVHCVHVKIVFSFIGFYEASEDGTFFNEITNAFQYDSTVSAFGTDNAAWVLFEVERLARPASGTEIERVFEPNSPDRHTMGQPIGPRGRDI